MQWLTAVSKYRAGATAAPNFAFALAHRKTKPALRDSYDLSNLKVCKAQPPSLESRKPSSCGMLMNQLVARAHVEASSVDGCVYVCRP
jgi:hypothetical protein